MDNDLSNVPDIAKALVALLLAGGWILKLVPLFQAWSAGQQHRLAQRREEREDLVAVVNALKTQIQVLMDENARLRSELAAARAEIEALSDKLDHLEYFVAKLPHVAREQCPHWQAGFACPICEAFEQEEHR